MQHKGYSDIANLYLSSFSLKGPIKSSTYCVAFLRPRAEFTSSVAYRSYSSK